MLDKIKNVFNIATIILFVIAFIYFLVISILNAFNPSSVKESTNIGTENVEIYIKNSKTVTNYTTFFNAESVIQNIILNLNKDNYKEVYSSFSADAKAKISKKYFMDNIVKYVDDNFRYSLTEDVDLPKYLNRDNLKMLYDLSNNEFIAVVTSNNSLKETKIGFKIFNNDEYVITYLDI